LNNNYPNHTVVYEPITLRWFYTDYRWELLNGTTLINRKFYKTKKQIGTLFVKDLLLNELIYPILGYSQNKSNIGLICLFNKIKEEEDNIPITLELLDKYILSKSIHNINIGKHLLSYSLITLPNNIRLNMGTDNTLYIYNWLGNCVGQHSLNTSSGISRLLSTLTNPLYPLQPSMQSHSNIHKEWVYIKQNPALIRELISFLTYSPFRLE